MNRNHWLLLLIASSLLFLSLASLFLLLSSHEYDGLLCVVPQKAFWALILPVASVIIALLYAHKYPSHGSTALVVIAFSLLVSFLGELYGLRMAASLVLLLTSLLCVAFWQSFTGSRHRFLTATITFLLVGLLLLYFSTVPIIRYLPEHCVFDDREACQGFQVLGGDYVWLRVALPDSRIDVDASLVGLALVDTPRFCPVSGYEWGVCELLVHDSFTELSCELFVSTRQGDYLSAVMVFPDGSQLLLRSLVE